MSTLEYSSAAWARSGLLAMRNVPEAALGDRVVVQDHRGRSRNGQVIRTSADIVLVQIFEGTDNLDLERTWVRFLDKPFELALAPEVLGRVFNGVGQPRDGRPPIVARLSRNVNGASINPAARAYPREFIQTGISTIDGMNTLVRGQKLPVFSGSGLPHNRLAAQIVRQAKLLHAHPDALSPPRERAGVRGETSGPGQSPPQPSPQVGRGQTLGPNRLMMAWTTSTPAATPI